MSTGNTESDEKTAVARWAFDPPAVDDFGSAGWETAVPILLTRYWSGALAAVERHAEARVIWSTKGLHALFACRQEEKLVVSDTPQTGKKTLGLWDRDVCEIFVAPDALTPEKYFEFEAAPTGEWLDVEISFADGERLSNWEFHSGLKVAANVEASRLLIGMFIPWSRKLPQPQKDDQWRANFFRCIGSGENRGYLAWQPTYTPEPGFHVPSAFGWLRFI
jgi:Carbohydrate family 9 binding domain-like